ncbi:MAG: ABC transporter [Lentisphaerae bacterium GWF2_45_14]|nr:MAG: ABC transporter [Lentisphaerae bacterium GWF2_45_14]
MPPVNDKTVVSVKNMSFSYGSGNTVLENVSFDLVGNETVCMVGPNGGGKTTLLNIILGLLKPDCGTVSVFGEKPEKSRIKIGYMPQQSQFDADFPVNAFDVVIMGRVSRIPFGRYSKKDKEAALNAMDEMGVSALASRYFSALSGGQRQRILIARALTCEPQLLLLDEPTANIDPGVQEDFYMKIEDLSKRMTILLVSHDLGVVSRKISSVICVNRTVNIHPVSRLNGSIIQEMYGHDLDLVRHDHICSEKGHIHE